MAVASGPWEVAELFGMWHVIRAADRKPLVGALVPLAEDNARYIADSRASIEELTQQVEDMYTVKEYNGLVSDNETLEELNVKIEEELTALKAQADKMRAFIEERGLTAEFEGGA